jgi:potassium-dependent mechanosensitive channel
LRSIPSFLSSFARLVALSLILLAGAAFAQNQKPLDLDAARAALAAIDSTLKNPNLNEADLQKLRGDNDPLGITLQAAISNLTPAFDASTKRLAELTPKSKDQDNKAAAPPDDAAAAELQAEQKRHDELDSKLRAARAMLLQVDDNTAHLVERRRELFASQTFERASSVFNPQFWISVSREIPDNARAMRALLGDWASGVAGSVTAAQALLGAGAVVLLVLLAIPLRWAARRVVDRDAQARPTRLQKTLAAILTIITLGSLPTLGLWGLSAALAFLHPSSPRLEGVFEAAFQGARLLIGMNALGWAMLAPRAEAWRIIPVGDRAARVIFGAVLAVVAVWAVERLIEPAADAIFSFNLAVAARALGALIVALIAAHALRRLAAPFHAETTAQVDSLASFRTVGWIATFVLFLATAMGYVAFAAFLINQAIFLTGLGCVLYLIDAAIHDGAETLLKPEAPVGARLVTMLGLRRNVLAQIVVIFQGIVRLLILIVAAAAVLEPWGVQSQDLYTTLRSAYFGFAVGGVTLSVSSIVAALVIFALVIFATRLLQGWLAERYLPNTRLDAGVSNSISTIVGYVGTVVAALFAASQVGMDTQKLAIVAGALSVGIGFGLQTIANNFVSGLILLWERGIRVGDWIVVGADQGFVRRINARATEIETFDRSTVIVPNANLVTGVVKNWVYNDRIGRILIAINVAFETDVEKAREILIAAAKAQSEVLKIPAPTVLFVEFGDWALRLNLICFVDDVLAGDRVKSEINFDILRRLREANIRIPYPALAPDAPMRFQPEPPPAPK